MDRSAVKRIVDRELGPLCQQLGIERWKIRVTHEPLADAADCARQIAYDKADIRIDADRQEDEADVIDSLLHELVHVVLAPFDLLVTHHRVGLGERERLQADEIWHFAVEQTVLNVMRMYSRLSQVKVAVPTEKRPKSRKGKR